MTMHTQGDWTVQNTEKDYTKNLEIKTGNLVSVKVKNQIIALCGLKDIKEVQANAKLIAAAPELLAACQTAMESEIDGSFVSATKWWNTMKDAINKATK